MRAETLSLRRRIALYVTLIRKAGPGAAPESTRKISQLAPKSTRGDPLRARLAARLGAPSFLSKT